MLFRSPYSNKFDTLPLQRLKALGFQSERKLDKNNFGPRVGVAYDVRGDGLTIARGGYGRYYDEIFQNITLYEYWSDVRHPTFFISTTPTFTANQYAANRDASDAIRPGRRDSCMAVPLRRPNSAEALTGSAGGVEHAHRNRSS